MALLLLFRRPVLAWATALQRPVPLRLVAFTDARSLGIGTRRFRASPSTCAASKPKRVSTASTKSSPLANTQSSSKTKPPELARSKPSSKTEALQPDKLKTSSKSRQIAKKASSQSKSIKKTSSRNTSETPKPSKAPSTKKPAEKAIASGSKQHDHVNYVEDLPATVSGLSRLVEALRGTSSTSDKIALLAANHKLLPVFQRIKSSNANFGITSKMLAGAVGDAPIGGIGDDVTVSELFKLLDKLQSRELSGNAAIGAARETMLRLPIGSQREVFLGVLDRNLQAGVGPSTLEKVNLPGPVAMEAGSVLGSSSGPFQVALAKNWDRAAIDFDKEKWYASRKLDGVRCLCFVSVNEVQFFSRTGKAFSTLGNFVPAIETIRRTIQTVPVLKAYASGFVLDGEVCVSANKNQESFSAIMQEIRRKNHSVTSAQFSVFDLLTVDQFREGRGDVTFADRVKLMEVVHRKSRDSGLPQLLDGPEAGVYVDFVKQTRIVDAAHLGKMEKKAATELWEGIILRKDAPYVGARVKEYLKVKNFEDAEFVVKGIETSRMAVKDEKSGKTVLKDLVSRLTIDYKGFPVGVGSGLSQTDRISFASNPDLIIGKTVTVKYFGESVNLKTGQPSLRFPTLKFIYQSETGRDV